MKKTRYKAQFEPFPTSEDKDEIFANMFLGLGRQSKPTLLNDGLRPTDPCIEDIRLCFSEDDIL